MIDYRALYEQQRLENEVKQRRITELEAKQKILERSFRKIFKLREELRFLQEEAETKNQEIQQKVRDIPNPPEVEHESCEDACLEIVDAIPEPPRINFIREIDPKTDLPPPALPQVVYNWDSRSLSSSNYRFLTRSRFYSPQVDELKLNFQFRVNSCRLPDKIQVEIKDDTGRIVFQKRQNIYYIKLQERISVLDPGSDYTLEVKTVKDKTEATETLTIHNKHFQKPIPKTKPPALRPKPCSTVDLSLAKAFQGLIEEVQYLEEAVPIEVELVPEVKALTPKRVKGFGRAARNSCVVLKRPQPGVLKRQGPIPVVKYIWQRGFRKGKEGVYTKVPILRVSAEFPESKDILPCELDYLIEDERLQKFARILHRRSTCEFQLDDSRDYILEMKNSNRFPEYESFFMPLKFKVKGKTGISDSEEWCEVSFGPEMSSTGPECTTWSL